MGAIIGLNKKQAEIYQRVLELEVPLQDALQALSPVLPLVGGVYAIRKVVDALLEISRETSGDAFEISAVLSLHAASRHGMVLSPSPIRVVVDDECRRRGDNMDEEEGLLLERAGGLFLYLVNGRETFPLVSAGGCKLWQTLPGVLAGWIDEVYLRLGEDGIHETRVYCGGRALDGCDTVAEFAGEDRNELSIRGI